MRDIRTPSTYFQHYTRVQGTVERSIRDLKVLMRHLEASQQSEGLTRAHKTILELEQKRVSREADKKKRMEKVKVIINKMIDGDDPALALTLMGEELSRKINRRLDPHLTRTGQEIQDQIFE